MSSESEGESDVTVCCSSCCTSYRSCCIHRSKGHYRDIEYQVLSKSHVEKWPVGQGLSGRSFTMPQEQSEINYALLERWGSQEILSRPPGKAVITHQPIKTQRSRTASSASSQLPTPPLFDTRSHGDETSPEIDFLLYYNISSLSLTVHLQRARHLPPKNHKNFVLLLYLAPKTQTGDTLQSTVLHDSVEPIINRSIVFRDLKPDDVRDQTLVFQLYNGSTMGNLVGGVTLPLSEADLYGMSCTMKIDLDREKIKAVNSGDLLLSLVYKKEARTLEGIILKLSNLKREQDIAIGLADVYVKIWLLNKGKRIKKWKSSLKQKLPAPTFNEPFTFDLGAESANTGDVALEMVVMERDRFSRAVTMGVVYVGRGVPHHTGRQHWDQVIAQSGTKVSNWHPILPISSSTL